MTATERDAAESEAAQAAGTLPLRIHLREGSASKEASRQLGVAVLAHRRALAAGATAIPLGVECG